MPLLPKMDRMKSSRGVGPIIALLLLVIPALYVGGYALASERKGNPFRGYRVEYYRLGRFADLGSRGFHPLHIVDRRLIRPSYWQGQTHNPLVLFQ